MNYQIISLGLAGLSWQIVAKLKVQTKSENLET